MTEGERFQVLITELFRIMHDPNESLSRRRKAERAYDLAMGTYDIRRPMTVDVHRGHSGGDFLHTQAIYEGWDTA